MAQIVTTELVIDGSGATAGGNVFEQAMASAEQAANSGVEAVSNFNAGLLAIGGGAAAAVVGVKAMLDYVVSANKDLADMATVAHQVGVTLTEFQGLQFGGAISGLSTDQINAGLEKSASLLNDASRNSNSLSKELDANGISIKNANGQLISENQLLGIAANLIKNAANPGDQLAIAQMLGFTKEWIPLLEQGSAAMGSLGEEAKAAGVVIDDGIIQRAAEFDDAWRKSSIELSSYMKAAFVGLLPYVDDLIQSVQKWVKALPSTADIQKAVDDNNKAIDKAISDSTGLPMEDDAIAIKFTVSQSAQDSWTNLTTKIGKAYDLLKWLSQDENTQKLLSGYGDLLSSTGGYLASGGPLLNGLNVGGGASNFPLKAQFVDPNSVPGFAASQITEPTYPTQDQMDAAFTKQQKAQDAADDAAGDAGDRASIVASKDTANDAVDRAINTLQRHTEAQIADAQAIGLGDAALAGFKADAAETAAVLANGGKETDAQVDKFSDLKDAAIAAADALTKAKVASTIQFGQGTAFLSAGDVTIATQLKGIYGNDIPAALASTEAAALRVNAAFREVSTGIENNLVSGLTDIATASVTASQGFINMGLAVLKTIEQMIIKISIVQPLMAAFQNTVNSTGIFGSLFGFSGAVNANGSISGALGPTSVGGAPLVGLHGGGIVGSEATFSRYVHPSYFDNAPKFHSGGIAGDEVPIIAKKGEGVFTPGQMAAMGGGGQTVITYAPNIDARGADAQAVARLAAAQAQDRQNFERNVQGVMAKTRQNNPGT